MENLPPGFRFYPTEEELVSFYLHNKLEGNRHDIDRVIKVVDIYNIEPWHLPSIFSLATIFLHCLSLFIFLAKMGIHYKCKIKMGIHILS